MKNIGSIEQTKSAFITTPALFRGLGLSGWQESREEEALKISLMCNQTIYTPLSRNSLNFLIDEFAARENVSPEPLRKIVCSISLTPELIGESFLLEVKEFLIRGIADRRLSKLNRRIYLNLFVHLIDPIEYNSENWYEGCFQGGNFVALNFLDSAIWNRYKSKNEELTYIASNFGSVDFKVLKRFLLTKTPQKQKIEDYKKSIELYLPDFTAIRWADLLEIRQDKRLQKFQDHINKISVSSDELSTAKYAIEDVFKAVEEVSPGATS